MAYRLISPLLVPTLLPKIISSKVAATHRRRIWRGFQPADQISLYF